MTVTLLIIAGVVALADWAAVQRRLVRLEYVLKPLTLVLLIGAASSAELGAAGGWVPAALILGLLGDIGLMLSRGDDADVPFLAGLGAFLIGHICYVVAFVRVGVRGLDLIAGLLVVAGISVLALPRVLRAAAQSAGRPFAMVVAAYAGVLGLMTVFAIGTGIIATSIGGVQFLASDTLIARERFVAKIPHGPVLVIVSYHLAQFLILIGLIRSF